MKIILNNRYLFIQMVKRDIKLKYKGSVLGMLWSIIIPLFMLIIYTFVFSVIFQAKWDTRQSSKFEFALLLYCGLCVFNMLSDIMNRSTTLIFSNVNYVKKTIFPLEILPMTITFSALFNWFINIIILIIANIIINQTLSFRLYQIFIVIVPFIFLCIGVSYILSSLSVYLKDLSNAISLLVMILMYMSPVFYSLNSVPKAYQIFCMFNPITYVIENLRNIIIYDKNISIYYLILSIMSSIVCYFVGKYVFKKTRVGFADVL